jgi:heme oxygenase
VLEEGLAANANDSVLSPTYNPALFARTSALSSDISFLLGVSDDDSSWKTHPTHQTLISSPPPAFHAYISRLTHLVEEEPRRLLAHSYIRYMGDLSGGQVIKRNIRKAYSLVGEQGTTFYEFGAIGSEGESNPSAANMGEVKRIKEWFRTGIDAGVGNDVKLKGRVYAFITFWS